MIERESLKVNANGHLEIGGADCVDLARQFGTPLYVFDEAHIRNMMRILDNDPKGKVYKLLSFAGRGGDIADPWYTGNFDETYSDVVEGCNGFIDFLIKEGKL